MLGDCTLKYLIPPLLSLHASRTRSLLAYLKYIIKRQGRLEESYLAQIGIPDQVGFVSLM